jgi:mRNA-degrading endonuclease toxin of MazEF toxin-antitoxin module
MTTPLRGELWLANLAPIPGAVASGPSTHRPVLVLSTSSRRSDQRLIVIAPLTKNSNDSEMAVRVEGSGLPHPSWVRLDAMHAISATRFLRRLGEVRQVQMEEVADRIRSLFSL